MSLPDAEVMTVVVAADSFLIGEGLAAALRDMADAQLIGRAADHGELLELVDTAQPDVALISIRNPVISTMETITAARCLRRAHPELGLVVISDREDGFAQELLRINPSRIAFLVDECLPDLATVISALRAVRAGLSVLDPSIVEFLLKPSDIDTFTAREVDVLEQMAHGLSNQAVATELHLSMKAIEKHITIIFRKLGLLSSKEVDRRVAAVLTFLRSQTIPFSSDRHSGPTDHRGTFATIDLRSGPAERRGQFTTLDELLTYERSAEDNA